MSHLLLVAVFPELVAIDNLANPSAGLTRNATTAELKVTSVSTPGVISRTTLRILGVDFALIVTAEGALAPTGLKVAIVSPP